MESKYSQFIGKLTAKGFPPSRVFTDALTTFAYSTDASFYRLIPKVVVKINTRQEAFEVIRLANELCVGLTFRAAGTSLSGQSSCEKVLVVLGSGFRNYKIYDAGKKITLEPALIGGFVNQLLAPYGRKIGPDPASIDSAMVGGIVANNSSGMCCGVHQNTYNTLYSLKAILADGSEVDTANFYVDKKAAFENLSNLGKSIFLKIARFAKELKLRPTLANRIKSKFAIKNTTGYSLNALVDYKEPFQIFQHLLIGSEGTLGFISEVTLNTVKQNKHRAVGLFIYKNAKQACLAVEALSKVAGVRVVELMDSVSLLSVSKKPNIPDFLKECKQEQCGLLVEVNDITLKKVSTAVSAVEKTITNFKPVYSKNFSTSVDDIKLLWKIRKELFPTVGTIRKGGTCVVIEDIVFPMNQLAKGFVALRKVLNKHKFNKAIVFGHALAGNLHFVFSQNYADEREVKRYGLLMDDVCNLVLSLDGSLKGEHGTGRNMAPFVEKEWGSDAYGLMKSIKSIFDEKNIFNADVIFSEDKNIHLKNFKSMAQVDPTIDKCTECGYCESFCPSTQYTLSPRQRIAVFREMARSKKFTNSIANNFGSSIFNKYALNTCAADGMCAIACPVEINTGTYVKKIRAGKTNFIGRGMIEVISNNFTFLLYLLKCFFVLAKPLRRMVNKKSIVNFFPIPVRLRTTSNVYVSRNKVVFFLPSCIGRVANAQTPALPYFSSKNLPIMSIVENICKKVGYSVHRLDSYKNHCCGLAFSSKGYTETANKKKQEVLAELLQAKKKMKGTFDGDAIVLSDLASCSEEWHNYFHNKPYSFFDSVDFIAKNVLPDLSKKYGSRLKKLDECVAVFIPCSARKMGIENSIVKIAKFCAAEVRLIQNVMCCGFAGDKGFKDPNFNASALHGIKNQVVDCSFGVSSSITCQIGLAKNAGIPFVSVLSMLDAAITLNEAGSEVPTKIMHQA